VRPPRKNWRNSTRKIGQVDEAVRYALDSEDADPELVRHHLFRPARWEFMHGQAMVHWAINQVLLDEMERDKNIIFGEDVELAIFGRHARCSPCRAERVYNTPICENR
jgi:hypothetical protein